MEEKFKFFIAGVKFHEAKSCLSRLENGMEVIMSPDPTNKYDSNAVTLVVKIEDETFMLGFVPAKMSGAVSGFLEYAEKPTCILQTVDPSAKTWLQLECVIGEGEDG